jgi:multicomponent K+:H+ antiporter subunit A
MAHSLLTLLFAPFAGSLLLAIAGARAKSRGLSPERRLRDAAWLAGAATAAAAVAILLLAPAVFAGDIPRARWEWLPALGVGFGLRVDGLAFVFAGLIVGIGLLIVLYARYYLTPEEPTERFFALLLAFMGAMLGISISDNLIVMVVFWELTSLSSFLLIGFWQHRADARQGARMALSITGAGGLCLLGGVLLLGWIAGSWDLDVVLASGDTVRGDPLYLPCLALVLLGAFTKSAQFPFHFWLPHAMAAPTPVSAYLHSATMVKAGVFLLARLHPTLSGTEAWFFAVTLVGATTMLIGAWHALFKHDLKGLLAYSTISQLGLITLLLGMNSALAPVAAIFHLLNHATFNASLFMAAGIIDHETGTRDMRRISGLRRYMPYTTTLAIVAAMAMAGVPLLNGFLSKEMFFAEALLARAHPVVDFMLPFAAAVGGALSVAYSARFVHDVFFGPPPTDLPHAPHEPPRWMKVPVELLVVLCLMVGLLPAWTIGPLLAVGAGAVVGGELPYYSLSIWHGFNLPLLMSLFALVAGLALYFWLQRGGNLHRHVDGVGLGKRSFDRIVGSLVQGATRITLALEGGGARRTLLLVVLVAMFAAGLPWLLELRALGIDAEAAATAADAQLAPLSPALLAPLADVPLLAAGIWAVGVVGAVATVGFIRQRLIALVVLGSVGLVVSLGFVWLSAPDLALTQLLVELATVLLMMLSLRYLPGTSPVEVSDLRKLRDGVIAAIAGLGVGALCWSIITRPADPMSEMHLRTAYTEGGGTNVVNVIIVDYRGFDTFGELTVLLTAGLIIYALLAGRRADPVSGPLRADGLEEAERRFPTLLATVSRGLVPFAMLVSAYFFLRGHNLPGGGFIAGLITALAMLLASIAGGEAMSARTRRMRQLHWMLGAGLGISVLTGVGSWFFGYPFLTSAFGHPIVPVLGELPLATAALFDLGVYLAVVGATVLALSGIAGLATGIGKERH